ncbi:MAG: cupin domain-containing protein [Cyclobacteriaceae bacterium]
MKIASLYHKLKYQDNKPLVQVLLETDFTREIRIVFKQNQRMQEHQTPYPIVVQIVEGKISFGVNGTSYSLMKGDLISLTGGVPHDLTALTDSVVRLTLSKPDRVERIKNVANQQQPTI